LQPLDLAGLGLDPTLAHMLATPVAWAAIAGVAYLLLRSSLVPNGVKLVVTAVGFVAAIGWVDQAGVLQVVTGHNVDDANKLVVALGATFVIWVAFLRDDTPKLPRRTEHRALARMLRRGPR
jgi:hypothetical protein